MSRRVAVVGGGAAGFFGAITCAENAPGSEVTILEKGPEFLQKVKISGGGRCNVTHDCFDPRELARRYPRGEKELIGLLRRFQARDTVEWFEKRGVALKAEKDGRMFPITDRSETVIQCLTEQARKAGVVLRPNASVEKLEKHGDIFRLQLKGGSVMEVDKVLLATGGCRAAALGSLATGLGHTLVDPVPSLFTFHIAVPWLTNLAGVVAQSTEVSVPDTDLKERGPLLITHWGVSGPVILRTSAWGARLLSEKNYRFTLRINWVAELTEAQVRERLLANQQNQAAKLVTTVGIGVMPSRLWTEIIRLAGIAPDRRWADLGRAGIHSLVQQLMRMDLPVSGKSLNKDEFVTCGGVKLEEVDLRTMESKICPGLYFAGELLNIDGITGGFNFQAAWSTGWAAGQAMSADH